MSPPTTGPVVVRLAGALNVNMSPPRETPDKFSEAPAAAGASLAGNAERRREPAATACGAVMVNWRPNVPADELSRGWRC